VHIEQMAPKPRSPQRPLFPAAQSESLSQPSPDVHAGTPLGKVVPAGRVDGHAVAVARWFTGTRPELQVEVPPVPALVLVALVVVAPPVPDAPAPLLTALAVVLVLPEPVVEPVLPTITLLPQPTVRTAAERTPRASQGVDRENSRRKRRAMVHR
jgi:hypothetical protein